MKSYWIQRVALITGQNRHYGTRLILWHFWGKIKFHLMYIVDGVDVTQETERETKQHSSMLPGPAVPACCLVSFCFLCHIHFIHSVRLERKFGSLMSVQLFLSRSCDAPQSLKLWQACDAMQQAPPSLLSQCHLLDDFMYKHNKMRDNMMSNHGLFCSISTISILRGLLAQYWHYESITTIPGN